MHLMNKSIDGELKVEKDSAPGFLYLTVEYNIQHHNPFKVGNDGK